MVSFDCSLRDKRCTCLVALLFAVASVLLGIRLTLDYLEGQSHPLVSITEGNFADSINGASIPFTIVFFPNNSNSNNDDENHCTWVDRSGSRYNVSLTFSYSDPDLTKKRNDHMLKTNFDLQPTWTWLFEWGMCYTNIELPFRLSVDFSDAEAPLTVASITNISDKNCYLTHLDSSTTENITCGKVAHELSIGLHLDVGKDAILLTSDIDLRKRRQHRMLTRNFLAEQGGIVLNSKGQSVRVHAHKTIHTKGSSDLNYTMSASPLSLDENQPDYNRRYAIFVVDPTMSVTEHKAPPLLTSLQMFGTTVHLLASFIMLMLFSNKFEVPWHFKLGVKAIKYKWERHQCNDAEDNQLRSISIPDN